MLNNLGRVHDALGQKEKALDYYQQALAIRREVGGRWGESVTLFNIGLFLYQIDRGQEGVKYLEQCVALEETIDHPDLENDRATLEALRRMLAER